jgi:hypothetical protein
MSTFVVESVQRADWMSCSETELVVRLTDGRALSVPLAWFPRLAAASVTIRGQYELVGGGEGIRWPGIDIDIAGPALLLGRASAEYLRDRG